MKTLQTRIMTFRSRSSNAARARQKVRRPEASSKRRLGLDYLEERLCPSAFIISTPSQGQATST